MVAVAVGGGSEAEYKAVFIFQPLKIVTCGDSELQCHLVVLRDWIQDRGEHRADVPVAPAAPGPESSLVFGRRERAGQR